MLGHVWKLWNPNHVCAAGLGGSVKTWRMGSSVKMWRWENREQALAVAPGWVLGPDVSCAAACAGPAAQPTLLQPSAAAQEHQQDHGARVLLQHLYTDTRPTAQGARLGLATGFWS